LQNKALELSDDRYTINAMTASRRWMAVWIWVGCLFAASSELQAKTSYTLDLGAYGDNLLQRLAASPSYAGEVSTIAGFARFRPIIQLSSSINFEPSIAFLVPWRSGNDGFAKTITAIAGLDLGWSVNSWFKLRAGTALQWNLVWGQGASVTLNNGTGTATFYTPDGMSNGFLFLVEAGMEIQFTSSVSVGVELFASRVMNAEQRRFLGAAYLGIYL
jgi:hypothetical protein